MAPDSKKIENMLSGVDRITACDGRTDGQTEIFMRRHSPRYAYASRGNKQNEKAENRR